MTRMVFCKKLGKELPGLANPPFPGPKGQQLFEQVSQEAWQLWLKHQTTLINEHRLNMMEAKARQFLSEQRELFFAGEDYAKAEGFVPVEQKDSKTE
jgi:Fe-S cluster biosynthesis and repair protein YggX